MKVWWRCVFVCARVYFIRTRVKIPGKYAAETRQLEAPNRDAIIHTKDIPLEASDESSNLKASYTSSSRPPALVA
jgi:hypothetical protein